VATLNRENGGMVRQHKKWAALGATTVLGLTAWLVPAAPAAAVGTLTVDRTSVDFGEHRTGVPNGVERVRLTATGDSVTIEDILEGDGNALFDFVELPVDEDATYCDDYDGDDTDEDVTLGDGESCVVDFGFWPFRDGGRTTEFTFESNAVSEPTITLNGMGTTGYFVTTTLGEVFAFGDAADVGDMTGVALNQPVVGIAATPDGEGYRLVASDGGIFSFNANFHGSMGGTPLNQPIVDIATVPDPLFQGVDGYYEVASDGGIFAFGDAAFHGSTGGIVLNQPIVGMAVHPSGQGYWLVAADGGVFAFGPAVEFHGSMGATPLNQPIVGMAATPSGDGYWLVAADGGIFSFGDADFFGSTGDIVLNSPITGMTAMPDGDGYWMVAEDGGMFAFDATFHGSLPSTGVAGRNNVVGMAGSAPPSALGALIGAGEAGTQQVRAAALQASKR
jgi:hypothetical protein